MDDGSTKVFKGYRQSNDAIDLARVELGPSRCGFVKRPRPSPSDTFKCCVTCIPMVEVQVTVDPRSLSQGELETIQRLHKRP